VVGITGWVDLDVPRVDVEALKAKPKLVGLRAQLRRIADTAFVERDAVVANLGAALRGGLGVTILAEARHYAPVERVLRRLPGGPVTINHLGLPFPDVDRDAWRAFMAACAGARRHVRPALRPCRSCTARRGASRTRTRSSTRRSTSSAPTA
jgi:predicted TIM-barrel fold metal-dependent hydrolase